MNIESKRLLLVTMPLPFLEAALRGDLELAADIIGVDLPARWDFKRSTFERRALQLRENPDFEPWSLRAMVLRENGSLIGQIGFHTPPDPDYLREYAPSGIEIGYSVLPQFRSQGYASEACGAVLEWASRDQDIKHFVLSISPANEPSMRIALKLGFTKVGSQWDDEDGEEDIYVRSSPYFQK